MQKKIRVRSPVKRDLRTPKYRLRKEIPEKGSGSYNRKDRHKEVKGGVFE